MERAFPYNTVRIRNDLVAAALPLEVIEIRGLQGFVCGILALLCAVATLLISLNPLYTIIALLIGGFIGWVYPATWVARMAANRKEAMSKALPFAIDLITVSMQAGQDFGAALRHLVQEGLKGPLATEFAVTLKQTELGKSRIDALKAMADRIQIEEFRSLVTSVIQSTEMGASIADTMKIQAEEIRRARRHKAERKAARAPSLMIIPVALFILPAVFIIIVVPVFLRARESGAFASFGGQ